MMTVTTYDGEQTFRNVGHVLAENRYQSSIVWKQVEARLWYRCKELKDYISARLVSYE